MKKIFTITIALLAFITYGQSGDIDLSFNPTDVGFGVGIGANKSVWTTSIQNDGKIIIGGAFTSYNRIPRNGIARLNKDGTLDDSFNPGTGANNIIYTSSIQSDGKIIIGGDFTSYNGVTTNFIARLNTDGTLDASFKLGTGADSSVRTTSIQNDGKIIIGGNFASYNGTARNYIARLNTDGLIDTSFNLGLGADNIVETTSIQSDGKIIIGGNFAFFNVTSRNGIARLNTDGTIDTSFNPGTGANGGVMTISIQSNGQLIIGGNFTSYNGTVRNYIARLNSSGTLDGNFDPRTLVNDTVWTTSIQKDGKIIIGGKIGFTFGTARSGIYRLNTDGGIDSTFGRGVNSSVYTTAIDSNNGKIIIGGSFTSTIPSSLINQRIARLNNDGTSDSFSSTTGSNGSVLATSIQSDGKIIIGGSFTNFNGIWRSRIARQNINGTLDTTFNSADEEFGDGLAANNVVLTTTIQNDGKIIVGGTFTFYNRKTRNRIARLNTDGTVDTSFNPGTGASSDINTTSIQSDGKIIIGGSFTSFNGITRNRIARLNTDGTIDTSFNPGTGVNGTVLTTSIQSDGKIIIGGDFSSVNGIATDRIARLNVNGTIDIFFNPGTIGNGTVETTSIQSNGKIIVGGSFNTTLRKGIVRLNADGTFDTSFNPGTGANGSVQTTSIQSDGKIIIGGDFSTFNGITRNKIARLNTDGTLDTAFNSGTGTSNGNTGDVLTTSIQIDGKIIIGGVFTIYNNIGRNRIARINGNNQLNTSDFIDNNIVIYPNPSKGVYNLNNSNALEIKYIDIYTVLGQKILSKDMNDKEISIDISGQPKGVYIYNLYCNDGKVKSGKLVLE